MTDIDDLTRMEFAGEDGDAIVSAGQLDPKGPPRVEAGVSGTQIRNGFLFEEPNVALQGRRGLEVYREMGFDPMCAVVMSTPVDVLRSAKWFVTPASDDPGHIEIADSVHHSLWEFGGQSMDDVLRQAFRGQVQYGHQLFEETYEVVPDGEFKGQWAWWSLAYRSPFSIYRWDVRPVRFPSGAIHRELVNIIQRDTVSGATYEIPKSQALLFTNELEGENYVGRSVLRACHQPWRYRQGLLRVQAVGLERNFMGALKAVLPDRYTAAQSAGAQRIVSNHRTHENAGIVTTESVAIDTLRMELSHAAMKDALEGHGTEILLAGRLQFLMLGHSQSGSRAVAATHDELFQTALNGLANQAAQVLNMPPGVQSLIRYNYANATSADMAEVTHGDIVSKDIEKLGRVLDAVGKHGFVTPDPGLENKLRDDMGVPELDETLQPEALRSLIARVVEPDWISRAELRRAQAEENAAAAASTTQPADRSPAAQLSEAFARMPWGRPKVKGGRVAPEDRPRVQAAEALAEFFEDQKSARKGWLPERPSIVAARQRRAYRLAVMAEVGNSPQAKVADINRRAREGNLKPAASSAVARGERVVTSVSRLGVAKHEGSVGAVLLTHTTPTDLPGT